MRALRTLSFLVMATSWSVVHAQSTPTQSPDNGAIEEVLVTAQKISESVQRAPAAITVVTAADAISRGIDSITAAEYLIPSAKFNIENNETQVFVRGVGKQLDQPYIPDAVATVLDGAGIPMFGTNAALFDLHSIEVLPGPQGTLYGSSSIGGVVNIVTNRPTREMESTVLLELGNFQDKHLTAVENLPITDSLSVRAAFNVESHSGYNSNGTDNENALAARVSTLYAPQGGDLTAYFAASFSRNYYYPSPTQYVPYPGGHAYDFPPTDTYTAPYYPPNGLPLKGPASGNQVAQLNGQFDWDFHGATLTYIPGYLHQETTGVDRELLAGFAQIYDSNVNHYTNELRLSSDSHEPISWLAGLYQVYDDSHIAYVFGPNFGGLSLDNYIKSYAAFGQATYSVTGTTRLTLGGRLSRDAESTENAQAFYPIFPDLSRGSVPFQFSHHWNKVLWKVGVEQDLSSSSMLYATVQTGFNPGTYQANLPNPEQEVQPQTMTGYTVGTKNLVFDSRLKLNLEAYQYDYKDLIIQAANLQTGATLLYNAPKAQIRGLQLDSAFSATKDLKVYANVGYLHAVFTDFTAATQVAVSQDFAGYQLAFSPAWTATIGAQETLHLGATGTLLLRGDTYVSSSYWGDFSHQGNLYQSSFTKSDLSLMYHSPDDVWELGLWGKNLEDKATMASAGLSGRPYPNAGVVYVDPPRTFGARFYVNFGHH